MKVSTRVLEIEPGWLLVAFTGEKPPPPSRPYWLRRSLNDWLTERGKKLERIQPIQHGELVGLMAWTAKPVNVQVEMPAEHLEALLDHAYEIYFKDPSGQNLAVVNRSGIAVVFDGTANVVPFDSVAVDDKARAAYEEWRTTGQANYFCIHLPERSTNGQTAK